MKNRYSSALIAITVDDLRVRGTIIFYVHCYMFIFTTQQRFTKSTIEK